MVLPGEDDDRPQPRGQWRARWMLAAVIGLIGAAVYTAMVVTGRGDSALLFVGVPTLLAIAVANTPTNSAYGRVTQAITLGLLATAVMWHEGFICVVLAAPLLYVTGWLVTWVVLAIRRRFRAYAFVLPLLLLSSGEGLTGDLRVNPDQAVEVVRVLPMTVDEVAATLAAGPHAATLRSPVLKALGMPVPQQVEGDGLELGDRWMFGYHGSAHGPGGHIVTEVTGRSARQVRFGFVTDTTINARWFTWNDATISWQQVDDRHTEVRLHLGYERRLDPFWYFGPIQEGLMHEGGAHLLDMLALR
ncbi:hypothetical protein [Catellatospora vulcania]|uniref:hypothetical protein n=1 Tax=Catellatospora vulcania TaxID=1460450 RepID=UPI0012D3A383|nr:hypothetical protein [Catellatospora vulcania]